MYIDFQKLCHMFSFLGSTQTCLRRIQDQQGTEWKARQQKQMDMKQIQSNLPTLHLRPQGGLMPVWLRSSASSSLTLIILFGYERVRVALVVLLLYILGNSL